MVGPPTLGAAPPPGRPASGGQLGLHSNAGPGWASRGSPPDVRQTPVTEHDALDSAAEGAGWASPVPQSPHPHRRVRRGGQRRPNRQAEPDSGSGRRTWPPALRNTSAPGPTAETTRPQTPEPWARPATHGPRVGSGLESRSRASPRRQRHPRHPLLRAPPALHPRALSCALADRHPRPALPAATSQVRVGSEQARALVPVVPTRPAHAHGSTCAHALPARPLSKPAQEGPSWPLCRRENRPRGYEGTRTLTGPVSGVRAQPGLLLTPGSLPPTAHRASSGKGPARPLGVCFRGGLCVGPVPSWPRRWVGTAAHWHGARPPGGCSPSGGTHSKGGLAGESLCPSPHEGAGPEAADESRGRRRRRSLLGCPVLLCGRNWGQGGGQGQWVAESTVNLGPNQRGCGRKGGCAGLALEGNPTGGLLRAVPRPALTHAQNPNSCTVSAVPRGHLRALPLGRGSLFSDPEA